MPGRVTFQHPALQSILCLTGKSSPRSSARSPAGNADRHVSNQMQRLWDSDGGLDRHGPRVTCVVPGGSAASCSLAVADREDGVPDCQILNRYPRSDGEPNELTYVDMDSFLLEFTISSL